MFWVHFLVFQAGVEVFVFWVNFGGAQWCGVCTHPVPQLGDLGLDEEVPVLGLHHGELGQRAIVQKLELELALSLPHVETPVLLLL